jgi:hypothetical protein
MSSVSDDAWLTAIRTEAKSVTRERRYEDAMRQYGALTQGVRMIRRVGWNLGRARAPRG